MSLDGFLTFFGLLIAGYAVLDPVSRLKLRIDAPLQIVFIFIALLIILPFEFVIPILSWLPERYAIWFAELKFGQPSDPLSNSHIAFIAIFIWAVTASLGLYFSRPRSGKLKRLRPLVERLHDEGRYLELLELVEPYLDILKRNALRSGGVHKSYDWLTTAASKTTAADIYLDKKTWRSPSWCRWLFVAFAWVHPSFQKQSDVALSIIHLLGQSKGVRDTLQTVKAKFAADFFVGFYSKIYDWSDLYLAESMENKDSHLRQDIQRPKTSILDCALLGALVGDAKIASKLSVWQPIGNTAINAIQENKSYQARLHDAPLQNNIGPYGVNLFDDITYAAIHFFDMMVRQAATQEDMSYMHPWYLYDFVKSLTELPKNTTPDTHPISDARDMKETLISQVLTVLEGWVKLDYTLPDGNPHKAPNSTEDAKKADAIPFLAAQVVCDVMKLVILSEKFSDDFKIECLSDFVHANAYSPYRLDQGSYLRTVLAEGLFDGDTQTQKKKLYDTVNGFRPKLSSSKLFHFPELENLLNKHKADNHFDLSR